jgi:hypothetical protein
MRKLNLLPLLLIAACNWGDFDDLADKTWVHSSDKPNIGSTDYGIAIVGVSTGTQGGQLAVLSNDTPNYSTLDYTPEGDASVGPNNQKLGIHFIASLSDPPILITDGAGKFAIVERAIDAGNIAVVLGTANMVNDAPFPSPSTPDAATFAGANVIVAAGSTMYTVTGTSAPTMCTLADTAFHAAARASDGTTLYVWSQTGEFYSVPVASPCAAPGNTFTAMSFMPATGAKVHLVGNFAVLAGHAMSSTAGQVIVVDTTTMTQVGTTLMVEGLRSSTVGNYGGTNYVAVGVPSRIVDAQTAGQVELHALGTDGMLDASTALVLNDAQPDANQQFGRQVATMKFNGEEILVVGAKSEIFAYYKTALYDALPQ